jgi:hypothetical protein
MLLEIRETLKKGLLRHLAENNLSIYKARKEKIKIGGLHINTVYGIINNPKYRPHNYTIISLLDLIGVEYDQTYYEANNIIKLLEKKELEN